MLHYRMIAAAATLTASAALLSGAVVAADSVPRYISDAVNNVSRPPGDLARDANRKPGETIAFAGVKQGDKVLEIWPGGGYFTRILSKTVGPKGKVYAWMPLTGRPPWVAAPAAGAGGAPGGGAPGGAPPGGGAMPGGPGGGAGGPAAGGPRPGGMPGGMPPGGMAGPPRNPIDGALSVAHIKEYNNVMPILQAGPAGYGGSIALPEQVDVVWTSDNYHDFHNKMMGPMDMVAIDKAIFRVLKPGGTYYIIDYNDAKGAGFSNTETKHRAEADAVKNEVLQAGFTFAGESDLLANPADDHSQGSRDEAGKADQYILKFTKPRSAPNADKRPKDSEMAAYYGNTFVLGTPDKRERTIFYHPDHSYQEFGKNDMQSATWFWDADGHNCIYHEFPAVQEAFVTCHPFEGDGKNAKVGSVWTEIGSNGQGTQVSLVPGYQYPTP